MRHSRGLHFLRSLSALTLVLIAAACSGRGSQPQPATRTTASTPPVISASATPAPSESQTLTPATSAPTPQPVADKNVKYQDDFGDPSTGWPSEKFDNYFTGYHEPDYFHIDVRSSNDQKLVTVPGKITYDDATIEAQVFTDPNNTAAEGDFRYGLAFRRSGSQFYAFTISPRTGQWFVLKSSPNALEVLKEGTNDTIQGLQAKDTLRVDAKGSTFFFHINEQLVDQVSDSDYASGEVGFFAQTFDIPHVHVHYDSITIRDVEAPQPPSGVKYEDDFSDPSTGWPSEKLDNYFTGYHEPDYFHIDVRSPNDKYLVTVPGKITYDNATIEAQVFTDPNNTAAEGDFRYGLAFRRSGSQFYAFTISPRTGQWFVLKSSPNALEVLKEGTDDSIQGLQAKDTLRVDAKGSTFFFHINDKLVDQVSDSDYASGEAGFFVQTFDIPHVHVHYDSLTIREVDAPQLVCTVITQAIRVRSGPSTTFDPPILFLPTGERLEAQGRSPDGNWIRVRVEASGELGWIYNSDRFVECNIAIADLPVVEP